MDYCEDGSDSEVSPTDCENDVHYDSDSNSSSTSEAPKRKKANLTQSTRFSEAQKACLNSFYSNGMTSTSRKHNLIISNAVKDTDLNVAQVKVHCLLPD